jgi:molybdopterin synthase catalytic subunit
MWVLSGGAWGGILIAMHVRVELFGRAASQTGCKELRIELPDGATLRDAAAGLSARFPVLEWISSICRPARNLEYCRWDDPLSDGDEVSFIPPVSGGLEPSGTGRGPADD